VAEDVYGMTDLLQPIPDDGLDEFRPPDYATPGRLVFEITSVVPDPHDCYWPGYQVEDVDWDPATSLFWVNEGVGFDWFVNRYVDQKLAVGFWVVEDVVGTYIRGDGWMTDDDEEWTHGLVRRASFREVWRCFGFRSALRSLLR
jgi:hypothetical protein